LSEIVAIPDAKLSYENGCAEFDAPEAVLTCWAGPGPVGICPATDFGQTEEIDETLGVGSGRVASCFGGVIGAARVSGCAEIETDWLVPGAIGVSSVLASAAQIPFLETSGVSPA
jgi:hypothetical protein